MESLKKALEMRKAKYTSRKRVGNKWVYTYGKVPLGAGGKEQVEGRTMRTEAKTRAGGATASALNSLGKEYKIDFVPSHLVKMARAGVKIQDLENAIDEAENRTGETADKITTGVIVNLALEESRGRKMGESEAETYKETKASEKKKPARKKPDYRAAAAKRAAKRVRDY